MSGGAASEACPCGGCGTHDVDQQHEGRGQSGGQGHGHHAAQREEPLEHREGIIIIHTDPGTQRGNHFNTQTLDHREGITLTHIPWTTERESL